MGTGLLVLASVSTDVRAEVGRDAVPKQHRWTARRADLVEVLLMGRL